MNLAIDCRFIGKSGIGTFIENIVNCMLKKHPENDYLLIVSHDTLFKVYGSARLLKTSFKPFSILELLVFPIRQINKCDAYYTPYINIPVGIKIPVYSTIHDMLFFDVDGLVSQKGKWIRKWFYRRAISTSEKVFTVSEFSRKRILNHFPTQKKILVVPNGIATQIRSYHLIEGEKENYFVFVGNIKKHKGIKCLLEAFIEARKKGMMSKLYIVGMYECFRTSDSILTDYYPTEGVEFTGYLPNEKLWEIIARAKALIQPSEYEGFGIPPLEALYLGTNVILSNIPVFKEVYHDLPVTFFNCGDSQDLSDILFNYQPPTMDIQQVRDDIDRRYSYVIAADKILSEII